MGANGDVWAISKTPIGTAGDFTIHKYTGSGWSQVFGGAVRIAVGPNGAPWVVNSAGAILRLSNNDPTTGTWEQLPGLAKDIGISDGTYAFIIGTNHLGNGNFGIYVWNQQPDAGGTPPAPFKFEWQPFLDFGGNAIAVGPNARPWVVASGGEALVTFN